MSSKVSNLIKGQCRVGLAALGLVFCVLAPLTDVRAQQASTQAPRTAAGTPVAGQTKMQPAKAALAGLPVIAVVHRLSGWQLRVLLTHPGAPLASTFDENFIRTNIVAGYVLPDGRSVVVRLPRADAEMLDLATQFRAGTGQTGIETQPLTLVRNDGAEFKANFVGLDASTGLSLLEAEQPLAPPAPEHAAALFTVGQRVRVIAPLPTGATTNAAAQPAPANTLPPTVTATIAPQSDSAPVGETGVIYMSMSEAAGQLTQIKRSPTGKAVEFTVEAGQVTPEWSGGVAFGETGALVGIVGDSDARAARVASAETVRAAAARVLAHRASVPQPWLGARGDSVALTPLNLFTARGWPELEARALVNRHLGVLLTDVAPGTPAAIAGLRPGDVVARISQHEVRSVEDMSLLLQELGSNAVANFTVFRAQLPPLDLPVRLSQAQNPALETAQAEALAAQTDARLAQSEARAYEAEAKRLEAEARAAEAERREYEAAARAADAAHREVATQRLRVAEQREQTARQRVAAMSARIKAAQARAVGARQRQTEAEARIRAVGATRFGLLTPPLLQYGLEAVSLWPPSLPRPSARAGLLVVTVRKDSAAARAGLRAGDIIETVNGRQPNPGTGWDELMEAEEQHGCTLGVIRDGQKLTLRMPPERGQ
ncbi:MAG TPA: PDZ domain-containing protein [Pyrinomonadaceae bacterium]|jgi:S1-C subfamily serine protease